MHKTWIASVFKNWGFIPTIAQKLGTVHLLHDQQLFPIASELTLLYGCNSCSPRPVPFVTWHLIIKWPRAIFQEEPPSFGVTRYHTLLSASHGHWAAWCSASLFEVSLVHPTWGDLISSHHVTAAGQSYTSSSTAAVLTVHRPRWPMYSARQLLIHWQPW